MKQFKQTGDSRYIYNNELDKACFQHDMAYGDFKDLNKRTAADKVLRDKAFSIARNPKYDYIKEGWPLWFINFLIKRLKAALSHLQINLQLNLYLEMNN